ncbi:hypothetical protein CKO23_25225 [Thiocystis violacea]|nr:hypothetical protein [Thiocystis violacea]
MEFTPVKWRPQKEVIILDTRGEGTIVWDNHGGVKDWVWSNVPKGLLDAIVQALSIGFRRCMLRIANINR